MFPSLVFISLCFCCLNAFADPETVKSVMEGESVSLESGQTEIMEEDIITWMFGASNTVIARINKEAEIFSTSEGDAVGFRDRLKLDRQTGSLNITNTRTTDSGLYQVTISGKKKTTNTFRVIVYDVTTSNPPVTTTSPPLVQSCDSIEAVIRLVVTALMGVAAAAAVVLLVNDIRSTRRLQQIQM